jgi:hypothetical protein
MLIVRVQAPQESLIRAIRLAGGFVVGMRRDGDGRIVQVDLVLREEPKAETLRAEGMKVEVLHDSRTRPDPREDVSKGDRYAEELARLQAKAGQPGQK